MQHRKITTPVIVCSSEPLDAETYDNVCGVIKFNTSVDLTEDFNKYLVK